MICAGGTQLGERDTIVDEAPWNDGAFATGGGISTEPRPSWQDAPGEFEFSPQFVKNRMVPDVSADAGGHLRIFWHGYGWAASAGRARARRSSRRSWSRSTARVPENHALTTPGDLYRLAKAHPGAFRQIAGENDRRYFDNTLRPSASPLAERFSRDRSDPAAAGVRLQARPAARVPGAQRLQRRHRDRFPQGKSGHRGATLGA